MRKLHGGFSWCLIICLLSLLCACRIALSPKDQVKNLRALPDIDKSAKASLKEKDIFTVGEWPHKNWWLVYNSKALNALMLKALAENPSLLAARSRMQAARQETVVVGSLLYPLVYFNGDESMFYSSQHGLFRALNPTFPLSAYIVDLSLSVNYEFDFWGQNHNLLYESIGKAKVTQAEAAQVALTTTTALAQAYFAYQTNKMRKKLYLRLVKVRLKLLELNQLLLKKGLASALPPYLAVEKVDEAKKYVYNIEKELVVDKHLINILAGLNPETPLPVTEELNTLPKSLILPETLSVNLVARRPDLMAQIWRAKSLAYKTGAAMADFYPNVSFIGMIGLESNSWKQLFEMSSSAATLKPAFNLPIFTAGAIRANVNANRSAFDAAIFDYNNLLLQSTKEVLDVLAFASSVYKQKHEQDHTVSYAIKRYKLTKLREQKGLDNALNRYYLEEEVIEKKLDDVLLLYSQYVASIKLTKSLGGGYCQCKVPLRVLKHALLCKPTSHKMRAS